MSSHSILLAHGSRDALWCQTLENGLKSMQADLLQPVSLAYMEMASPSLETQVIERYQQGDRHFIILPLFFSAGRHLLVDVPGQLEALQQLYPDVSFSLKEPLGKQAIFWQFLSGAINDQLSEQDPVKVQLA